MANIRSDRGLASPRTISPFGHDRSTRTDAAAPMSRPGREARAGALGLTPPRATPGYLPGLDGLRALAVAAVVAYHLGELPGGFLGVDVFFVVSGFLITRLLLAEHERTGRIALGAFWKRRFRRLLPALLVLLGAVALGSRAWLPAWRLGDIRDDGFAALAYVANWRFILSGQSYFSQGSVPSPLRHTWSLAIEEQFYVVWPLVVVGALAVARGAARHRVGIVALVGAVVSAGWMAASAGGDLSRVYYGTDTRLFALCAGAALACWWAPHTGTASPSPARLRLASTAGLVALLGLVVVVAGAVTDEPWFYRGGFQVAAVLSVVLVAGVATGRGPLSHALAAGPLVWVGRRSYGIYLWSWPIQVVAAERFRLSGLSLVLVVVAATMVAATLSHWLVEEPVRLGRRPAGLDSISLPRRAPLLGRTRVPGPVVPVVAVVAVVALLGITTRGAPEEPTYLAVSDDEVLAAAQAPPVSLDDEGTAGADAGTGTGPDTTTQPGPALATGEPSPPAAPAAEGSPSTTVVPGPVGPFDPAAPLVVDPAATADPASVRGRSLRVLVAGDSVGWSIGWRVQRGLEVDVSVDDRALIGCGLMPAGARFLVGDAPSEGYPEVCSKVALAEEVGIEGQPDVVLLWLGAWEVYDQELDGTRYRLGRSAYADYLEARLQERIDRFRAAGVPTVMPVVPCFGPSAASLGEERNRPRRVAWVNQRIRGVAERNPGWVRLIDPSDQLCEAGRARTVTPTGLPLRQDGSHFDEDAAAWFWNAWLGGQLAAAFAPATPAPTTPRSSTSATTAPTASRTPTGS